MQINANAIAGALDLDLRHASALEPLGKELADGDVFLHVVAVALTFLRGVGEPAARVVGRNTETEPVGIDLLAH